MLDTKTIHKIERISHTTTSKISDCRAILRRKERRKEGKGGKGEERREERGGQGSLPNRNVSKIGSYFAKFPGGTRAGGRSYPRTPSLSSALNGP